MNDQASCKSPAQTGTVSCQTVPFTMVPGQSRLFLDYQSDPTSLTQFYPNAVDSVSGLEPFVSQVLRQYKTDRKALCDALGHQNKIFGAVEASLENIDRLRKPGTVAVVTGQQAGLFTGPLYTIYKAISAIKTAEDLTSHGISAVPIFWIATEDHDFDEVASVSVIDREARLVTEQVARGDTPVGLSVGEIRLDASIKTTVDALISSLARTEFTAELRDLIAAAWQPESNFGESFGRTLASLLSRFGLILIDPMAAALKRLAAPIYSAAVERVEEVVAALTERGKALEAVGYDRQVAIDDNYFPFFLHTDDGVRSQVRKIGDDRYWSRDDKREFTLADLKTIASDAPERLSPGVMVRAAVQDYLLPTACYIGGGAEVAYFAQLAEVYRVLDRPITPIFHRQSYTIVESPQARALSSYGIEFTDLFDGVDVLTKRIVEEHVSPVTAKLFADVEEAINAELDRLGQKLSETDETLAHNLARRRKKIIYHIEGLREKAYRSELQRSEIADRRLRALFVALLPDGHLQERVLNFAGFYNKYGSNFVDWVYDATDVDERRHKLLFL